MHQGEPYFRLTQFSDFAQLMAKERADALVYGNSSEERKYSSEEYDELIEEFDPFARIKDPIKVFIITPRGMVGSKRTRWNGDL